METMKSVLSIIVTMSLGQALAQTPACAAQGALNSAQIRAALGGKWACAKDGADMWNENIASAFSGAFQECHSGTKTGPDPIDPNKGTFVINNNTGQRPDSITYTYPPNGGSYTYQVYEVTPNAVYTFCRVTDGKTYTVHIASCPPSAPNTCP